MSNIIKVHYSKTEDGFIAIQKIDNLLSSKEIVEKYGMETLYLYSKAKFSMARTMLNTVEFKNKVFSKPHIEAIRFYPWVLSKESFSEMVGYMREAGNCLVAAIKNGQRLRKRNARIKELPVRMLEI